MYKAVLFDVDGTLLDTTEYIYQGYEYVFEKFGLKDLTRESVLTVMGKPLEECYAALAPSHDYDELCKAHREFQEGKIELVTPYPNTLETLQKLKELKLKLAIISTRKRTGLQTLEHTNLLEYFDAVITGDDTINFKPHPEGLFKALEKIGGAAEESLMVGDTVADVEAGKNAKTKTAAATYGFVPRDILEKSKPDFVVEDIADLIEIVRQQ